jgi:hypothetical protein
MISAIPASEDSKRLSRAFELWIQARDDEGKKNHGKTKRTAAGIPTWSPTVVLICRSTAYVWQSGRDAQFSADYGRTCLKCFWYQP